MIDLESFPHCRFPIIVPLNKRLSAEIVLARSYGRVEFNVVRTTRAGMDTAPAHSMDDNGVIHRNFHHRLDRDSPLTQGLGLRDVSRKPVEQTASPTVGPVQPFFYETHDDIIRNQSSRIHDSLGPQPQLGTSPICSSQHVSGGDLRNTESLADEAGLRTLSRARPPQQYRSQLPLLLQSKLWCVSLRSMPSTRPKYIVHEAVI